MQNTSRCREKMEGRTGRRRTYKCKRWRTYKCKRCGKKFQEERLTSLPPNERYCPECWQKIKEQNKAGEITIQRLLEDFEQAEISGSQMSKDITWKGRQFQVLVFRKQQGYDNFEIHVTKRRIR